MKGKIGNKKKENKVMLKINKNSNKMMKKKKK